MRSKWFTGKLLLVPATLLVCALTGCGSCSKDDDSGDTEETPPTGTVAAGGNTGASGAGTGSGVQGQPYQPTSVPGTVAVQLPDTLADDKTAAALWLQDDDSAAADGTKAEGYDKLVAKTSLIPPLVAAMAGKLYALDTALPGIEAECDARLGAGWTSCQAPAASEVTFNEKMLQGIVFAAGEGNLTEDEITLLQSQLGKPRSIGTASVTKLTADPFGYVKCVDLVVDASNTTQFCFNAQDLRSVHKVSEERETGTDENGVTTKAMFTGTHTFGYVADKELFTLSEEINFEYTKTVDKFTIQRNKSSTGTRAVLFTASISESIEGYGAYAVEQSGLADDDGGFVSTKYTWFEPVVTSLTLSGPTESGAFYGLFPASKAVTAETFDENTLGFVYGEGASNSFSYFGPVPAPTGLKLWKFDYDDNGDPVAVDSGLTVTSIDVAQESLYYEEEFGKEGLLGYWCYRYAATGSCDGTVGTAGAHAAAYRALDTGTGVLALAPVALTFSGTNANAAHFDYGDFIVVPGNFDLTGVSPTTDEWRGKVLAYGSFGGDWAAPSTTNLDEYTVHVYAPTAAAFASVRVFRFAYSVDGTETFTEVTSIVVTAQ